MIVASVDIGITPYSTTRESHVCSQSCLPIDTLTLWKEGELKSMERKRNFALARKKKKMFVSREGQRVVSGQLRKKKYHTV